MLERTKAIPPDNVVSSFCITLESQAKLFLFVLLLAPSSSVPAHQGQTAACLCLHNDRQLKHMDTTHGTFSRHDHYTLCMMQKQRE